VDPLWQGFAFGASGPDYEDGVTIRADAQLNLGTLAEGREGCLALSDFASKCTMALIDRRGESDGNLIARNAGIISVRLDYGAGIEARAEPTTWGAIKSIYR
jgi:hypothetical protein